MNEIEPKKRRKKKEKQEETFFELIRSLFFIVVIVFAFKFSVLDANNIPSPSMVPTLKVGDYLFVNKMRYSFRLGLPLKKFNSNLFDYDNPEVGDIITFDPPPKARAGGKTFVKRVVAAPGDSLRLENKCIEKSADGSGGFEIKNIILNNKPIERRKVTDKIVLSDLDDANAPFSHLYQEKRAGRWHYVLYDGRTPCDSKIYKTNLDPFKNYFSHDYFRSCSQKKGCKLPKDKYFMMGDNRDNSQDSRFWGFADRSKIYGKVAIAYFSVNWRDRTCQIKNSDELYKYSNLPYKDTGMYKKFYKTENIFDHCYESTDYNEIEDGPETPESLFGWMKRMLTRRLWRADVRWSRIAKLIK